MPLRTPWLPALLCSLFLALAACGGGGGGTGDPLPGPVPSLPEPVIVATSPIDGAPAVPETTDIGVEVSEAVDMAAILADHLTVRTSAGAVPGDWGMDPAGLLLTFNPAADLPVGAEIHVEVAPTLPFASGAARTTPYVFTFVTRAPTPEPVPGTFDHNGDVPFRLLSASHPTGGTQMLYGVVRTNGYHEFHARFRPTGGDYEARKPMVQGPPDQFRAHALDINADGDAAWAYQGIFGTSELGLLRIYDRQTDAWTSAGLFQSWSNRTMGSIAVALDGQGNVFVAWQETDPATGLSYVGTRRRTAGGTWEDYAYLDDVSGDVGSMFLDANDQGDAAVVWQQRDASGVTSCYGAYYEAGAGWQPQQLLETVEGASCWMRGVTLTPDGRAVALLDLADGAGDYDRVPHLAVHTAAGQPNPGWQPPVGIPGDRGELSDYGVHATGDGTVYAIYSVVVDASYRGYVRAVRFVPATGAMTPLLLSAPQIDEVDGGDLQASVTPGGEVLVAWTEQTIDPQDTLKAAIIRPDGRFVADIPLRGPSGNDALRGLRVAAGPGGGGMVVWTEPDTVLGGDARRLPGVCIAPDGAAGPIGFLDEGAPGDLARAPELHLDATGSGAVVWFDENLATGAVDLRQVRLH